MAMQRNGKKHMENIRLSFSIKHHKIKQQRLWLPSSDSVFSLGTNLRGSGPGGPVSVEIYWLSIGDRSPSSSGTANTRSAE
jgi:hypothetical protein